MQSTETQKKSGKTTHFRDFPRRHIIALGALTSILTLTLFFLPSSQVAAKRQPQPVALAIDTENIPDTPAINTIEEISEDSAWTEQEVRQGDNLSIIFKRAGLNDRDVHELMSSCKESKTLKRIHPGHKLAFQIDTHGKLTRLRYIKDRMHSELFFRTESGFSLEQEVATPDIQLAYREAVISSSLFSAGQKARLDSNLIMEMANIFGWDIDFALDIRQGDSFKLLFEELFLDGEKIGNGAILAAEFTNRGNSYRAVRYTNKKGVSHYFTPEGESMRKEFIRTPVELARISSHFNLKRKHPVLNRIRAHKGTDYAAPRGTPIKAAGDGKIIHAGRKGGYGNTVIIQHGQKYKTLYAHLHKFHRSTRKGKRVKQGQIIGYVGSTGLATGPHLHYEFYVNGSVRNPVRVKLPKALSVAKADKKHFLLQTRPFIAELTKYQNASQIALATSEKPEKRNIN